MERNKETLETWNKVASLYQDKFMNLDLYNETYDFICSSILRHKAMLLEIGCGPGNITKYLLSKRPDFHILGIDFAPTMIELAKRNNPDANYKVMDCRNINELKTKFDGIIGGFCLPYLSQTESEKLISDAYDLLTDHGLLYLSFVEGNPGNSDLKVASSGDRTYFYYHELAKLKSQLIESNFDELKIVDVLYDKSATEKEKHTILTAKKKKSSLHF